MKSLRFLSTTALSLSLLYSALDNTAQAQQSSCDTCSQLSTLNAYAADTSTNTAASSSLLEQLLKTVTNALFGILPALGNGSMMAAFTTIPAVEKSAYDDEKAIQANTEAYFQGSTDDATLTNNYSAIFHNYLLQEDNSSPNFDANNASIASLYLHPDQPSFHNEDQNKIAANYIYLVSGAAASAMRKPSSDWLTISGDHTNRDKKNVRQTVSLYYTYSAMQSAIADNFAYIYGLNTGKAFNGKLENYSDAMISESGLFSYIQSQKVENKDWYKQLAGMGVVSILKEQTILMGGCFLMLSRIEEDMRRLLITNSTQTSLLILGSQALSAKFAQQPQS